jgi:CRISPR-associated protein Cmr5
MPSPQQTMEQKRAQAAWADVLEVKADPNKFQSEYQSLVQGAPADVLTNGLGQTLAFLKAKGKGEHQALLKHLNQWVCPWMGWAQEDDLLRKLTEPNSGSDVYRRATAEAMAYLVWLKRFAEAELG